MQVTLGPVQAGGSICAGKIKQRHDPHMLSTVLHAASALHERSGAAGVPSERIGSGGFGAAASAPDGAFAPDTPDGVPTRVPDGCAVAASRALASGSVGGTDAAGACPPGSLES